MEIDMTALRMVEQEKGVSLGTLVGAIEEALLKAYHNIPGAVSQARIEIDRKTGRVAVIATDEDEDGNPIGEFDDTPKNFGRIAQSTARSIIVGQPLRLNPGSACRSTDCSGAASEASFCTVLSN